MNGIEYRAMIECGTPRGNKGRSIVTNIIDELIDKIIKSGDSWVLNHAHRCHLPIRFNKRKKQYKYKSVDSITDIVESTIKIVKLNREEKNACKNT